MSSDDPFRYGLDAFAESVRFGECTFAQGTRYCLDQIDLFNPKLNAFEYIDREGAIATSIAMDALLAAGTDLGPLMGVPIGVKDIITVDGMPVTNGSLHPTSHLNGEEGSLIKTLRRKGCVILGKTKTVEFALGATGINEARGTPWNPWDLNEHRIPGGSSSGSAVATASRMCAFALGTDTGGSIRIPACYNGLFGHKTSIGLWPTDGVFPLSPTLDSIGPICRTANDAVLIHQALHNTKPNPDIDLRGMRFAKPHPVFFDELDTEVAKSFDEAQRRLKDLGADVIDIQIEESSNRNKIFPLIVGPELISSLGVEEFEKAQRQMDTVTRQRASIGLDVLAKDYINALRAHNHWKQTAHQSLQSVDAWISPTVPMLPNKLTDLTEPTQAERALLSSRNTQPGNLFGLCAASLPTQHLIDNELPTGFQIMMASGQDTRLLQVCRAVQKEFGTGSLPELS